MPLVRGVYPKMAGAEFDGDAVTCCVAKPCDLNAIGTLFAKSADGNPWTDHVGIRPVRPDKGRVGN